MGSGKSSVGRLVAGLLQFQFLDTDDLIEMAAQKSIAQIFAQEGQAGFRKREAHVVAQLDPLTRSVIATGGGLGADPAHLRRLKQHALVVYLRASPEVIWQRVRHHTHRPLLQGPDPLGTIHELLARREPVYLQADVLINAEQRSLREVAQQVVHHFEQASTGSVS